MSPAPAGAPHRFDPAAIAHLDEPVRRYLGHALHPGAPLEPGVQLEMRGRIRLGVWIPFTATWRGDGRSFRWAAVAGPGRLRVLHAVDRFADGSGRMDVRLFGRVPLITAADEDTTRSAAGRTALEAIWTPASLLPDRGVTWSAESGQTITATWDVPPERPRLRIGIDERGAVRHTCLMRWDGGSHGTHGYIPFGAVVHAERRFGDITVPTRLSAGWWFGTERWESFFEATVVSHGGGPG